MPKGKLSVEKNKSKETPNATSGTSRGKIITPRITFSILLVTYVEIIAVVVPSIADSTDVNNATFILILKDSIITLSLNKSLYQSKVKPVQEAVEGLLLNEYKTTPSTGIYKITKKSDK